MTACHRDQHTNIENSFRINIVKVCNDGPNRKITELIFIGDRRSMGGGTAGAAGMCSRYCKIAGYSTPLS